MLITLTLCLRLFYATESKINQLHQKMAEVKVESVEMQSRAEDAENQRSRVQDMLDRVSKDLDEVRCVCHFIDFDVCLMHII
jgi:ferritin-like metal-binding protein YciE